MSTNMTICFLPSSHFRRFHNGSLHILPFFADDDAAAGDGGGYSDSGRTGVVDGGASPRKGEYAVRCRASNAYGRVVSRLVTVKPGELTWMRLNFPPRSVEQ